MSEWTPERTAQVMLLLGQDMTYGAIARLVGLSRSQVRKRAISSRSRSIARISAPLWTEKQFAQLKHLRLVERLSYSKIGERMNMTKNAVIGKATRERIDPSLPSLSITMMQRLEALDIFPGPGKCVFPIGEPGRNGFYFCGQPVEDGSYCPDCIRKHKPYFAVKPAGSGGGFVFPEKMKMAG